MAIHVDIHPKNLKILRDDALNRGMSVRDLASMSLNDLFSGDRSVFMFTPALSHDLLPRVEFVFQNSLNNMKLFDKVEEFVQNFLTKEKENDS